MKYLPALNVNAPGVYEAVRSGQLRLQPGQWVWTSEDRQGKPSRFVSAKGYLNIVHPTGPFGTGRFPQEAFLSRVRAAKRA